ncbi:MAG: hypothetical protein ACR2OX_07865 [Methyloligellaceae bacterium]
MGSPLPTASWNGVEGAYYMGMNTTWEPIWLFVSIAMCVMAVWVGGKHEADAYSRKQAE